MDNYPVVRNHSLIGLGGGEDKMYKAAGMLGNNWGDPRQFIVIPFDNSKIVFSPVLDMELLIDMDADRSSTEIPHGAFTMVDYSKNFKIPIDEITKKQSELKYVRGGNKPEYGFEFFTSSPCLLVNYKLKDWLYSLRK